MRVVIIGSGNVASSLAILLCRCSGIIIEEIYSRNAEKGEAIASNIGVKYQNILENISCADIYIVAVTDEATEDLMKRLGSITKNDSIICHTSGVLQVPEGGKFARLYPLQTFTSGIDYDFSKITFFIEANCSKNRQKLITLCRLLGSDYREVSADKLKMVHLAATFANNFTNRMYHYAEKILEDVNLDRQILYPLIEMGLQKMKNNNLSTKQLQTGAAARKDDATISMHREMLVEKDELLKVYDLITEAIYKDDKL